MGRRFSETEVIAMLAISSSLVVRYRVEVKDFAGETFEQKKERLLEIKPEIALT